MKHILLILVCLFTFGCSNDEDEGEPISEVPPDIIPSKPCETLYESIMNMYPEHQNNQMLHPALFSDTVEKRIVLTRETEVYISFISEGAGWANSLGYYTYDATKEPPSNTDFEKKILFAHVSDTLLSPGDMVQVGDGPFPAGTSIGFFLIMRGWENNNINWKKSLIYTDFELNKNDYQQHILFREGQCGDVVLAFEDRYLDDRDSDYDYNDVIFTISDNSEQKQIVSFDLDHVLVK